MVQTFFKRSCTIDRLRQGPLAGHIDLLAERLAAHGFSRVHSRIQLRLVGHFNRWLDQKGISAKQLDEALIERYWHYFERKKRMRSFDVGALGAATRPSTRARLHAPARDRSSTDAAGDAA